jgi:hypothetical protein
MEPGGSHGAISRRHMGAIERKYGHPTSIFFSNVFDSMQTSVSSAGKGEGA